MVTFEKRLAELQERDHGKAKDTPADRIGRRLRGLAQAPHEAEEVFVRRLGHVAIAAVEEEMKSLESETEE